MTRKTRKNKKADVVKNTLKTIGRIDAVRSVVEDVNKLNRVVSSTLQVRDGIAIDEKNFSLTSIPSSKEIFGNTGLREINDY
ncbi:MAG: hypothetical protein ABSE76_00720 [Minisyncoccia bacterium]|jgi:hypothetical protein